MKVFALASAIYGHDDLKFTTSVVAGESKDEIKVEDRIDRSLDPDSESNVSEAFNQYLATIKRLSGEQRRSIQIALPIIFGWPTSFDPTVLVSQIRKKFSRYTKKSPDIKPLRPNASLEEKIAFSRNQSGIVEDLIINFAKLQQDFGIGSIDLHRRAYVDWGAEQQFTQEEVQLRATEERDEKWDENFRRLIERAATNIFSKQLLRQKVKEAAASLVRSLILTGLYDESRFIMTGYPNNTLFTENLRLNFFHGNDELRKIFAEEVIRLLRIKHNICIKCPRDPSSPPFSDVAATYIADALDMANHGRIRPTVVMVKH